MKLTEREKQIISLLCLPTKEIANRLNVSIPTVKTHIINISNKLTTDNRASIIVKALKEKFIEVEDIVTI